MSRAIGPDISKWQDDNDTPLGVDFDVMKAAPSDFVIIKAGQNNWLDPDFAVNWAAAKAAGLARGSYWFYDSRSTPQSQAQRWADALSDDAGELPLFADYEENYGGRYGSATHFHTFLKELERLMPEKEIAIYTGFYFWEDRVLPEDRYLFSDYELWIARYSESEPWIPEPWEYNEWLFWQYTAHGPGPDYGVESLNIDLNYYNGIPEEFRARFKLDEVVPPDPPTEPPTGEEEMIAEAIDRLTAAVIRSGKDTVDAIKNLDVSSPPNDPTDPPTPSLDWSDIQVRANPENYPRRWELSSTANNGINVPFYRNNDITDSKIILWDGVIVKEHLPPSKYWSNISELMNILNEFAWVRAFNVEKPANGKWFHMPTGFITTAGKPCDNWFGGAFVRREDLQAA